MLTDRVHCLQLLPPDVCVLLSNLSNISIRINQNVSHYHFQNRMYITLTKRKLLHLLNLF